MAFTMSLLAFAGVFFPLSLLVGVSAAVIGFTAFSVVVPFMFVALGYGIYDSIFISVAVDLCNALTLVVYQGLKGNVKYGLAASTGLGASCVAVLCVVFVSQAYLDKHTALLKGSLPFTVAVFGVIFTIKGILEHRTYNREHRMPGAGYSEIAVADSAVQEQDNVFRPSTVESPSVCSKAFLLRLVLTGLVCIIIGGLSGIVGLGGGTAFTTAYMALYNMDTVQGNAAGMCSSMLTMIAVASTYLALGLVDLRAIYQHLLICVGFSVVGVLLGLRLILVIERKFILSYLVATTMWIMTGVVFGEARVISQR